MMVTEIKPIKEKPAETLKVPGTDDILNALKLGLLNKMGSFKN